MRKFLSKPDKGFAETVFSRMSSLSLSVLEAPKTLKRAIVVSVDSSLCCCATWLAFYIRLGEFVSLDQILIPVTLSIVIAVPIFAVSGLYRIIFRYSGWPAVKAVAIAMIAYSLFYSPITMIHTIDGIPRTIGVLQPLLLFFGVSGSRLVAKFWLGDLYRFRLNQAVLPKALIYGAGVSGQQLASALFSGRKIIVLGFIDDDVSIQGRTINGLKIYAPEALDELIFGKQITHLFLAMPAVSRTRRHQIIDLLSRYQLVIRTLPSLVDIADGKVSITDIKELDVDDLLGRKPVHTDTQPLQEVITDRTVLVSGAGGSIGSELSRQIIDIRPKQLILLDFNEHALYVIESELQRYCSARQIDNVTKIFPVLCNIQDEGRLNVVMSKWNPDTVYHAAAFKHVPLVETNVIEAFKNNVLGTLNIVDLAIKYGVKNFVLVSSDKAVRPTNVMGATKRMAEMIVQAKSSQDCRLTTLSMVRFGNVLASSGSVIPKFRSQIRAGGPVTVTHPEVTRYFMTIPEAAKLLLFAGSLAHGGEVFLLDMGQPIKIVDLARRMITLSGLSERTVDNPDGDIEIEFVGLRPGEKLFEELLIGRDSESTSHPKIMKAVEKSIPWPELSVALKRARESAADDDVEGLLIILSILVEGFEFRCSKYPA